MLQTVLTYILVAAALLWVGWSVLLPGVARRRLRQAFAGGRLGTAGRPAGGCGDGCGCGAD